MHFIGPIAAASACRLGRRSAHSRRGPAYIENAGTDIANLWVHGGHFAVLLIQATLAHAATALKADANWD